MHPDPAYIKALFIKHADGSITPEEAAVLVNFLQQEEREDVLPLPDEIDNIPGPGMDAATTGRMMQRFSAMTAAEPRPAQRRPLLRRIITATAAAAAAITAIVLYYPRPQRPVLTAVSTGYGTMKNVLLPDGTTVTLNANSVLQYDSTGWKPEAREVWIKGQAFFDVAPDAAGKFMVYAGDSLSVQVLGTRFNIAARAKGVQVVLNSGKVKVDYSGNGNVHSMTLLPGELAYYNAANGQLTRQTADTLQLTCWKDNQKVFHEATLDEIATFIEEQFGAQVKFDAPQLSQLQFTGTTPANDLDMLLNILTKSLDIRINKHNNQVMIMLAR